MAMFACLIAVEAAMTKEAQQNLGALHFTAEKPPRSAAESWQQVTLLYLDNVHKTRAKFSPVNFSPL